MNKQAITNAKILRYDNGAFNILEGDLFIADGKIEKICPSGEGEKAGYDITDAKGALVTAGLINLHTHLYMTAMRNYADDLPFNKWLFEKILPLEDTLTPEFAYIGSQLGIMECIQTGTTTIMDMNIFGGQTTRALSEIGMRGYVGRGLVGEDLFSDGYSRLKESLDEIKYYGSELVKGVLSPHAIYSCSEKLYRGVIEESKRLGWLKQTHLSESAKEVEDCVKAHGVSPVKYLEDVGFLDDKTILAHCVHISDEDIEILAKTKAGVVTNPASNLKLENGICPATKMVKAGVNLCIGTDGTASNNTQNMFREMNLFNLIHNLEQDKVKYLSASKILECVTVNPAKALGEENCLGVIKEGAKADLVLVDLNEISLFPNNNIISSLSSSANGSEVKSVMINGKWVYKNKEFLTVDKEKVYFEANRVFKNFL